MVEKRRRIWCAATVLLAVLIAAVAWNRYHFRFTAVYSLKPALPKLGDQALVDLRVPKPIGPRAIRSAPDYSHVVLSIKCTKVRGDSVRFDISYVAKDRPNRPAYYVLVDYSTNDLRKQVSVRDLLGKAIPINRLADGFPVPFRFFFATDPDYLGADGIRDVPVADGTYGRLVRHIQGDHAWRVYLSMSGDKVGSWSQYYQFWGAGCWLWHSSSCSGTGQHCTTWNS